MIEINNVSESNITNILWTSRRGTIYISNSSGSFYSIMVNEFNIKINNQNPKNQFSFGDNNLINNIGKKNE